MGKGKKGNAENVPAKQPAAAAAAPVEEKRAPTTIYEQYEAIVEAKEKRKQELENPKPAPVEPPKEQKSKKEKETKASEPKQPSALEDKVKGISEKWIQDKWSALKGKFPDKPEEWIKGFADDIIRQIGDAQAEEKDDSPLCYASKEAKAAAVACLSECEEAARTIKVPGLPSFFSTCMAHFATDKSKSTNAGLRLVIQLLLVLDATRPQLFLVHFGTIGLKQELLKEDDKKAKATSYPDCPPEMTQRLAWVLRQVLQYSPNSFILVWKSLLMPIAWGDAPVASKDIVAQSLTPLLPRSQEEFRGRVQFLVPRLAHPTPLSPNGLILADREFSVLLFLAFSTKSKLSDTQRRSIRNFTLFLIEILLTKDAHLIYFPLLLNLYPRLTSEEEQLRTEILRFIVRFVFAYPKGYDFLLAHIPTVETASQRPSAVEGVAFVVNGISSSFKAAGDLQALDKFLVDCNKKVSALLSDTKARADLDKFVPTAEQLVKLCKTLRTQLFPSDSGEWFLWAALVVALLVFAVLLAHLACHPSQLIALPPDVCNHLEQWGFLQGVDKFYEFAAPALPYVEKAIETAQPYVEVALEVSAPYTNAIKVIAGDVVQVLRPHVISLYDHALAAVRQFRNQL